MTKQIKVRDGKPEGSWVACNQMTYFGKAPPWKPSVLSLQGVFDTEAV